MYGKEENSIAFWILDLDDVVTRLVLHSFSPSNPVFPPPISPLFPHLAPIQVGRESNFSISDVWV